MIWERVLPEASSSRYPSDNVSVDVNSDGEVIIIPLTSNKGFETHVQGEDPGDAEEGDEDVGLSLGQESLPSEEQHTDHNAGPTR